MIVIKLTTPWKHKNLPFQIDPGIEGYKFEVDNDCDVCNYWIVWGDLPGEHKQLTVKCQPENLIFMTDEAHENQSYNPEFLKQFARVITCRDDLSHKNIIRTHEINQWQLGKTFEEVNNKKPLAKSKTFSVVASDLTILSGHKKRYAFVNRMIGHFKDRLDVYGRGFNPIDDKWQALQPYKYSIAIENSATNGYFTEKITECYLAHTYPIYFGAPDISEYFDGDCLLSIDINDYKASINLIEKLLEEDPWASLEDRLIEQKLRYLNKYHLFHALINVIKGLPDHQTKPLKSRVKAAETFISFYALRKFWQTNKHKIYG